MRLLPAVTVLLVLAATLAGCAKPDPLRYPSPISTSPTQAPATSSRPPTSSATATSTAAGNGTAGNQTGNHPPTGGIQVVVNGTTAAFNLTGSDADNDTLSWTLAFGDGNHTTGTSLPAAVNHTYAAGNYTANFTVSDGHLNRTANATFAVGSGAAGQVVSGTWTTGVAGCASPQQPYNEPLSGKDDLTFAVDPATVGAAFTATFTDGSAPVLFHGILFFDGATPAARVGSFNDAATPGTPIVGAVPAGAVHGMAYSCGGGATVAYAAG